MARTPCDGDGGLAFLFDLDGMLVDSAWDLLAARRAPAPSIGLLSGGYGWEELGWADAYGDQNPGDLLQYLDEGGL